MACEKCKRSDGHFFECEIIAPFIDDGREIAMIRQWKFGDNKTVANVASLIEKKVFPIGISRLQSAANGSA